MTLFAPEHGLIINNNFIFELENVDMIYFQAAQVEM
jgi:hypothetical protein